jgi:hypothetical protein
LNLILEATKLVETLVLDFSENGLCVYAVTKPLVSDWILGTCHIFLSRLGVFFGTLRKSSMFLDLGSWSSQPVTTSMKKP